MRATGQLEEERDDRRDDDGAGAMTSPMPDIGSYTCTLHEVLAAEVHAGLRTLGLPQAWLAERAGYSEKHVSQMLTGRVEGSLLAWEALLRTVERWPLGKTTPARVQPEDQP